MTTQALGEPSYRRDLGGGLVLRWSTAADVERLAALYGQVFRDKQEDPLNENVGAWVRDMMGGEHPLLGAGDFALVEDTDGGAIISATCLMNQTWEYEGVAFPIGRPEIVATVEQRRTRGLVRAIFELIHARSAARGHLVQAITGIPYYYRQFGYEYALDLGGYRGVFFSAIPKLKDGEPEPYTLRDATRDDLPRVLELYDRERARGPVSTKIDPTYWRWMLDGQRVESGEGGNIQLIVNGDGATLGYVLVRRRRWTDAVGIMALSVEPGVPLPAVLPSLLRAIQALAPSIPTYRQDMAPATRVAFIFGREHPVYDALGPVLAGTYEPPYAWYVRVPDVPGLLRTIAPALEQRLAASPVVSGYTGELRMDFYRDGLRMAFAEGRLTAAEDWSARAVNWGPKPQAGFPPLVFLQLLFGHRSLDELRYAFPDVWAEQEVRTLLEALFPAQPSWAMPLD
jgi:hypothetical protein